LNRCRGGWYLFRPDPAKLRVVPPESIGDNCRYPEGKPVLEATQTARESIDGKAAFYFMAARDDPAVFNKACTEFVRSVLSILPSLLERLVSLASLRDLDTGEYQDRVLEALLTLKFGKAETDSARLDGQAIGLRCGSAELDRALRQEHLAVFEDWLCLSLRQQIAQLEGYASRQGASSRVLFGQWMHARSYERLVPSSAMPFQRRLFATDMETVLTTLSVDGAQ
jgi:hypothetical protein